MAKCIYRDKRGVRCLNDSTAGSAYCGTHWITVFEMPSVKGDGNESSGKAPYIADIENDAEEENTSDEAEE